jgi:hypothetical protein
MKTHKIVIELETEIDISTEEVIDLFKNLFSEGDGIDGVEVNIVSIDEFFSYC